MGASGGSEMHRRTTAAPSFRLPASCSQFRAQGGRPAARSWQLFGASVIGICVGSLFAVPAAGQTPAAGSPKASAKGTRTYAPPKTAWGDPDLQGIYTNKDESGIPFERPSGLAGKNLADVNDDELKDLIAERSKAAVERAPGIGGADTGAGPAHWYEHYGAKNSRA